jgi:hypothetical protein
MSESVAWYDFFLNRFFRNLAFMPILRMDVGSDVVLYPTHQTYRQMDFRRVDFRSFTDYEILILSQKN